MVQQVLQTISNNYVGISTAIKEGFQRVENRNVEKGKTDTNANRIKQHISTLWKNTLNSRKQAFFQYYKAKNIAEIFTELLKENPPKMQRKFLPKIIPNENKEETAIRQQLSLEKFKAEISLQKIRSRKYLERFQTLDAHMIAHFTMNYDNNIGNSLTELWENDCLKEQQKSVNIFDRKRDWYLNNTTTEFRNNSEERKPKQESKQNNNSNRRTQNGQSRKRYKNSKDRSRSRSSTQKGTNNQGAAKQDAKNDKDEEYPTPVESRNYHSDKKRKHRFGKFNRPSKQQKNKTTFDVVVIEPIRIEKTEERRQSQTVIVPDAQETEENQQSNGEDANNFLLHGQGATRTNQTNNNSPQSHKFI